MVTEGLLGQRHFAIVRGIRNALILGGVSLIFAVMPQSVEAFEVYGLIGEKYAKLRGNEGPLGQPTSDEIDAPFGGRVSYFQAGAIYWHPSMDEAFAVWGDIAAKYHGLGGAAGGYYPITDERSTTDGIGRFNHFESVNTPNKPQSSIFWSPETGAHAVWGEIRRAWANYGWESGELGYPITDEFPNGELRQVNFQNGSIVWSPTSGIAVDIVGSQTIDPGTNLIPADE